MSAEQLVVAFHHSRASGTAKLALICIANYGGDGDSAVDMPTLAKFCNAPEWAVDEALDHLEGLGEIQQLSLPTMDQPRQFRFTLRCPSDCLRDVEHHRRGGVA